MALFRSIGTTLEMIKWEHSVLTLPFGLTGAVLAARGIPSLHTSIWIVVALVAARSAAMAFNRLADATIDAANPRTRIRALPAGKLSKSFVAWFVVVTSAILILAAYELNPLAFYLSPVALGIVFLYSFTKRFTRWSHVVLGLAMGIAPAAAWIAVRGSLDPRILILTAAVVFWGAGFDILYACQDYDFDRAAEVYSVPKAFRHPQSALLIARIFHLITVLLAGVDGGGLWAGQDRDRGRGLCGAAADLRTLAGEARRPQPGERRLLHHERPGLDGLPVLHRRRFAAGAVRYACVAGEAIRLTLCAMART